MKVAADFLLFFTMIVAKLKTQKSSHKRSNLNPQTEE